MKHISDEKLFELCRQYGKQALMWRRKFLGLLPEVYSRKLYEKKGFGSIFEFAAKLAGVSKEQARMVLNLEKKLADKPILKAMLESGEVSVNKLARIASVATPENDEFFATQVRLLPQSALETLVRDGKSENRNTEDVNESEIQNGLFKPNFEDKSVRAHRVEQQLDTELQLSPTVREKLLELQRKGVDVNELLLEFFEKREWEIAEEKEKLTEEASHKAGENMEDRRYIPMKIKNLLKKEFGTKCSVPKCKKTAEVIHHTNRFSLSRMHNPYFLAPLCRGHHLIAHSIDQKFQHERSSAYGTTPTSLPLLSPAL